MSLSRSALQALSWERLREARLLAGAGHWPGAYYLSGYAVECALEACIVKKQRRHEVPFDRAAATRIYSHDLVVLLKLAQVPEPDPPRDCIKAVGGTKGVLSWLRRNW